MEQRKGYEKFVFNQITDYARARFDFSDRKTFYLIGLARKVKKYGCTFPDCSARAHLHVHHVECRSRFGKKRYLDLLPRVARHFVSNLQHPAQMPLLMWAKANADAVFREAHK